MDRTFSLKNSFSGKSTSQGNKKGETEEFPKQRGKQPDKRPGFPDSSPLSKSIDDRLGTCLWMTIDELMTREIVKVYENTSIEEILSLYGKYPYHILPVVNDKNELVGIIDLDIILEILLLCLMPREKHTLTTAIRSLGATAKEIMITHPITISLNATLKNASDLMIKYRLDRICVIEDGKLVGVISKRNLIEEICKRRKEKLKGETD
ncbi:putative manganese-dependent inorganic pyrophosphatase [Methanosarcina barkeri 3]|uniref:Manganese-dependent inorganic pyrophosphatase n=1 Tax=Methanosarcina barkeri 3 TaxID=1434107 RepID=A0A0E3WXP9_METBA|nr:CBS domain-containing protein [Methanosarcina barkeri]AKB83600.1 putative manganese-dependent inorganic pyrophosphatase [Methanosarcina barkeri 3]